MTSKASETRMDDPTGMFSAASFSAILSSADGPVAIPESDVPRKPIVAFYGFRGGAGRTTALAYVAGALASRQMSVLAVDLDLEAPGLAHVLSCPPIEADRGVLSLLRAAATNTDAELADGFRLAPHLVKSGLDLGGPIRVLPAGTLSPTYLTQLDDLGVPLWHVSDGPSPLVRLLDRVRDEIDPDVILLDCRTGLSGLTASALFHIADVVVCFLPLTQQSLEGLDVILDAARVAHSLRGGLPRMLLVPSMVPEGTEGRDKLRGFLGEIERRYVARFPQPGTSAEESLIDEAVPIVRDGIEYRRGIALDDGVHNDLYQRTGTVYRPLIEALDDMLDLGNSRESARPSVNAKKVLEDVAGLGLEKLAFAESTDESFVVERFIRPADFQAIVDRSTWYVVGSKGSGKTWLYRYLLSASGIAKDTNVSFVDGHGPAPLLSANSLKEIEKEARLEERELHGSFWLIYAANRTLCKLPNLSTAVEGRLDAPQRKAFRKLSTSNDPKSVKRSITDLLSLEHAGSFAEDLIRGIDEAIGSSGTGGAVLLYDGLDTGFGSDARGTERRRRFVNGFAQTLEQLRGGLRRLSFKVFLREDIYADIDIQNQSHLAAATVQLQWRPRDLWLLTLNLVSTSDEYMTAVRGIDPSASAGRWPDEEDRLQQLLVPLWGDRMERGKKVSTARFIQRRTADGLDRLFPRTLVQLLARATSYQQERKSPEDRVISSAAIQHAYVEASKARVADLQKEYVALAPYLKAIEKMNPTGTLKEIVDRMRKRIRSEKRAGSMGPPVGALHSGPGGWTKFFELMR
jgi:MinD-like ATPase involved in chromosome partitioning or flagellar assembly